MIISLIDTLWGIDDIWSWAVYIDRYDDEPTTIHEDVKSAMAWCHSKEIEVRSSLDTFYFKTREDQIAFMLRWNTWLGN